MTTVVSGQVFFDDAAGPFSAAALRIKLEDVSRVDAAAREVSQLEIHDFSHTPGDPPLDFVLTARDIDPKRCYGLRVHLDLNGSGEYSAGDQITMESYPVVTQGAPATVQVRLHRI